MDALAQYLTIENIIVFIGALEAFFGALPNKWVKYRSFILRFLKYVTTFLDELGDKPTSKLGQGGSVRLSVLILPVLAVIVALGCAHGPKSPKERAIWIMSTYTSQFDDYMDQVIDPSLPQTRRDELKQMVLNGEPIDPAYFNPDLTEAQKQVLRTKRRILMQLYPLARLYTAYVKAGDDPPYELEDDINRLINELYKL